MIKKLTLALCLFCSGITLSYAEALATVTKTELSQNEVIQLMVTTSKEADKSDFSTDWARPDFQIGTVSFASSKNFMNGEYSIQNQWTVSVVPNKLGTLTIPSFTIAGEKTEPITLTVKKDSRTAKKNDIIQITDNLNKSTLYEGEYAEFDTKITIFSDLRRLKSPQLIVPKGNNIEIIPKGEQKQYTTAINGRQATVIEQSFSINAKKAGALTLKGLGFSGQYLQTDRYGRSTKLVPLDVSPKSHPINVKPKPESITEPWLPTPNLSLGQRWLVDNKGLASSTIEAGTAITRKITLKVANIPGEKLPGISVEYPKSVRVYDEKPIIKTDNRGNSIMTLKQVIIPYQEGKTTLPEIAIRWWNSKTETQETATLSSLTLNVVPNTQPNEQEQNKQPMIEPEHINSQGVSSVSAGFWPYTTFAFALLWLLTLIAWSISHKRQSTTTKIEKSTSRHVQVDNRALLDALRNRDLILAQQIVNNLTEKWIEQGVEVDRIKALISQLAQQQYAETQHNLSTDEIVKEIERILKNRTSKKEKNIELETL